MTELRTVGDPSAIPYSTVTSALELLGIYEHADVISVLIDRHSVTVERMRRNEDGYPMAAGDEVATTTNVIAIKRDERS